MKIESLKDKTAVVTGGSRGLGLAIATELASQGVNLHLVARKKETVDQVAKNLAGKHGISAWGWGADVSRSEDVEALLKEVQKASPRIEILINNAGITRDGLLLRMSSADFESVMDTNLKSVFLFSKGLLRTMVKQRYGRVVNISSVVGVTGQAGQTNYAASKAGIIGFSKSFVREVANRNITCNVIAPGFIRSDMTEVLTEAQRENILSQIPQGKFGEPEDVARLTVFLASDEAGYINGQVLGIDGGLGM